VVDVGDRIGGDQHLGQRRGLGEEGPVIGLPGKLGVPCPPEVRRRDHLDDADADHPVRVVEREPIGHARAPVVTEDVEPADPQPIGERDDIQRHPPLGVDGVTFVVRRRVAVAVAAQVRHDHPERPRQRGRDLRPAHVVLRIAVKEDQRRPLAAHVDRQGDLAQVDPLPVEPGDV
jgi:hypothetical protein